MRTSPYGPFVTYAHAGAYRRVEYPDNLVGAVRDGYHCPDFSELLGPVLKRRRRR